MDLSSELGPKDKRTQFYFAVIYSAESTGPSVKKQEYNNGGRGVSVVYLTGGGVFPLCIV